MTKLNISHNFALPQDTVTSTLVVYGGKGMGKTNFGAVLLEEMTKVGLRWCLLDPMGVAWGLRHSRDGKGPGVECLILGGPHGDIPIEPTGGEVVADLVADERVNVIIDISRRANGEAWGVGEKIRFATDYGKRLLQRQAGLVNGRRREPLFQVIDEAARFIPQTVRSGEAQVAMCVSVWAQIVEEGRNFGLGVGLLTQRSARLNKDVAELADVMIAFRTIGPNSVAAVMDWLGEHIEKSRAKQMVEQLRTLPRGSALLVSPGWLQHEGIIAIRERETFDSSATPKPGEQAKKVTGKAATPDLQKYSERMAATIEKAKADDPKELKKRITELERELAKKLQTVAAEPAVKEKLVEVPWLPEKDYARLESIFGKLMVESDLLKQKAQAIFESMDGLRGCQEQIHVGLTQRADMGARKITPRENNHTPVKNPAPKPIAPSNGNGSDITLNSTAQRILGTLAAWYPKSLTESQVASMNGLKARGGAWGKVLRDLRAAGMIESGNPLKATEKGVEHADVDIAVPQSTDEVLNLWRPKLSGTAAKILDVLVAQKGNGVEQEDVADLLGVKATGGGWGGNLRQLKAAGLLVSDGRRIAANRETLFL